MTPDVKAAFSEAIRSAGSCVVTVDGKSMWPFILPGDRLTVIARSGDPVAGSVAACFYGDQLIVHRIVRCRTQYDGAWEVALAGDSSPGPASRVRWSDIIGTVASLERAGTLRPAWLHPPLSRVAVVIGYLLRALVAAGKR